MTRINVFRTSKLFSRLFIILGCIFAIFGILLFIKSLSDGFDTRFPSGDWNSVTFFVQGLLFITMGVGNLMVKKYFIEWDDIELRFLLPKTKKIEVIKLSDIVSVNIKLFEIQLNLQDRIKTLDLSKLQFEDLKKIKEQFESFNKKSK
jgi:hypothetical protein